jgi:energy-coupling factor transporter ATP-binding protein EcfA2
VAIKLIGKNFQSLEYFDLDIKDLTVVVGESNLGKSAISRSLKGIVRNELNAGQVRVGSDLMEVTAIVDGRTIEAKRKKGVKGSIVYVVDKGEPYAKLGGAIPQEVLDLNMGEIQIGEVTLDPIFATQFASQFIIEEKPGPLNAILGAFSSTERLETGKKVGNKRIGEKNTQANLLAEETRETEERLATLEVLTARAEAVQAVMDRLEPKVRTQENILGIIEVLIAHKLRLALISKVLLALPQSDTEPAAKAIQLIATLATASEARYRHVRIRRVLDALVVPDVAPVAHRISLVAGYTLAAVAKGKHDRTASLLSCLTVPDASAAVQLYHRANNLKQLASSSAMVSLNTRTMTAVEEIIANWTSIVALHKRGKTLTEAGTALEVLSTSVTKARIAALDEIIVQILARVNQVEGLQVGITRYELLGRSQESRDRAQRQLSAVELEYAAAIATVAAIEADRAVEQKKPQGNVVVCGKCGEKLSFNSAA